AVWLRARGRRGDLGFEPITSDGVRIALIAAPPGIRGTASNRQRYVRHPAGLDHRRYVPIHWAADTHGDKSESPAARNEFFQSLSAQVSLPTAPLLRSVT